MRIQGDNTLSFSISGNVANTIIFGRQFGNINKF